MQILVAFDHSGSAEAALRTALRLAHPAGGHVLVLRVLNPSVDAADIVAPSAGAALVELIDRERPRLDAVLDALPEADRAAAEGRVEALAHGEDVAAHVVRVADECDADLIAIGSSRASGLRGLVLGSVTQHVLRMSGRPVLVVRPEWTPAPA